MDDPEGILDAYIHDYLVKRRYSVTSRIFQAEAAVPCNTSVIEAPGGFLYEWWSVFWDIFIARYKLQNPGSETQVAHEQEIPQQLHQHSLESLRNKQMNEYLLQRKLQQQQHQQLLGQQRRKEIEMDHRARDPCSRQPDIMSMDTNQALTMRSLAGQSRNIQHSTSTGISYLNPLISEGVSNTPLEGWPLNVRDHFQHRLQQQQLNSLIQFPHAMNQYQLQQNYALQAQPKSLLSAFNDLEGRQLGSGLHEGYPLLASGNGDVVTKQTQQNNEHRQQHRQGAVRKKSQNSGGSSMFDDSLSNSSQRNDQTPFDCFAGGQVNDNTNIIPDGADNQVDEDADNQVDEDEGGSTFSEIGLISTATQVNCCNLSSDGKLLVTGGYDKKANVWSTDLGKQRCVLEEHSDEITDARFSLRRPWLATSSFDQTIKVWDVENPNYSLQTFCGHSAPVTSLDFHPNNGDLICSCDSLDEIRYWSVKNGGCDRVLKGGGTQVRFQPNRGRYIASVGNGISILDVETTQLVTNQFKGHALNIQSVCWDFSGEFLASTSKDRVRVWKIGSGAQPDCIHELSFSGKEFCCCVFHPQYCSLLVIGCSQSLDLWNMAENKLMTPVAEPVCALAVSETSGLVASASRENGVKMWKWI
ncbi:transcriptional corepressor LEUNIG_HOMOLOG-like isoform X2 [Apium graveolens]|uniref:transcriptional corepressor LEUNIG_HOMOLOG-like isoform X2 n=1 Tax=Apium graveolens TaxID=4045 RepID=UPI003D799B1D